MSNPATAGMAWFGLLYMGKLAILSGLASNTSNWPCSISAPQQVASAGATFWVFGLTAHQLAELSYVQV
jgi:hypothetical protein